MTLETRGINTPTPLLLSRNSSEVHDLHGLPGPQGNWAPAAHRLVTGLVMLPSLAAFTSLSHFPTSLRLSPGTIPLIKFIVSRLGGNQTKTVYGILLF